MEEPQKIESPSNHDIATKLVKKHAEYSVDDHKAIDEYDEDVIVHTVRLVNVYGMNVAFHGKTKAETTKRAVEYVESELDAENLVLSSIVTDSL